MKQNKKTELTQFVARLERLCDHRDLMLEEMREIMTNAEKSGFDRDAICCVLQRRLGDISGTAFHNRNAMKYMHALGDVGAINEVAA